MGIQPVKGTEMQGAFSFRVLESDNDSIRIQFENHTTFRYNPCFSDAVGTEMNCIWYIHLPVLVREMNLIT